ncbi:ribosome 60S biogenesis N-terminal-domain-containing protein [Piptocephalis cylindrospora]|uniref:Ribosome 60S biogenesis N-terminal-domain-containing protein n=1 Tax=Piptocephalis cylindrospora TaxID=1907219 RepID=A0A4P9YAB8_9FUNG|nr:ribosome 60S biogenesis N-terminal-domain-containing protein [Piptocephalis cylindrospora]|eukprot:RKP15421.1 ribosome 60S biogenesis N-terminal-domain-containing protein [Piptocephalis cylindrospora]
MLGESTTDFDQNGLDKTLLPLFFNHPSSIMPTQIPTSSAVVGPALGNDTHASITCPAEWKVSDCFLNVVELSEALESEDPPTLAVSLTRLLHQLALPVDTYPAAERAVEDYLGLSPRLNRLFAIWEHARESQDRSLYIVFDVLSLLIRRLPYLPGVAGETVLELVSYLTQELNLATFLHPAFSSGGRTTLLAMRFLHFLLALPSSDFGLSIGIRTGPRVVRTILGKLDLKYLHRHASATTRKEPSKLAPSDEDTKLEWLSDKEFLLPLWRPLFKDTSEAMDLALQGVLRTVVEDDRIRRSIKNPVLLAGNALFDQLQRILDEDEEDKATGIILPFLRALCCRPDVGLNYREDGWYPMVSAEDRNALNIGKSGGNRAAGEGSKGPISKGAEMAAQGQVHNRAILRFIKQLRPTEKLPQRTILLDILQALPELSSPYWKACRLSYEPRLSLKWLCNMELLLQYTLLPIPPLRAYPPPVLRMADMLIPQPPLTRAILIKALQISSPSLVRYKGLLVLRALLDLVGRTLEALEGQAIIELDEIRWKGVAKALRESCARRLPDPQMILGMATTQRDGSGGASGSSLPTTQDALLKDTALSTLRAYVIVLRPSPVPVPTDVTRLFQSTTDSGSPSQGIVSPFRQAALLELLSMAPDFRWTSKSPFEHRPIEVICWLRAFQDVVEEEMARNNEAERAQVVNHIVKTMDGAWERLHISPYRYYDSLAQVRSSVLGRMNKVKGDRFSAFTGQVCGDGDDGMGEGPGEVTPSSSFSPLLLLLASEQEIKGSGGGEALRKSLIRCIVGRLSRQLPLLDIYILHGVLEEQSLDSSYLSPLLASSYLSQCPSGGQDDSLSLTSAPAIQDNLQSLQDPKGTLEERVSATCSLIHALIFHQPFPQALEVCERLRAGLAQGGMVSTPKPSLPSFVEMERSIDVLLVEPSIKSAFIACAQTLLPPHQKVDLWVEEEIFSLLLRCIYSPGTEASRSWYRQYLTGVIYTHVNGSPSKTIPKKQVTWLSHAIRAILTVEDALGMCKTLSREGKGWSTVPCPIVRALAHVIQSRPLEGQGGGGEDEWGVLAWSSLSSALPYISRTPGLEDLCSSLLHSRPDVSLDLSASVRDSLLAALRNPAASLDASVVQGRWRLVTEAMGRSGDGMRELHRGVVGLVLSTAWPPTSWSRSNIRSCTESLFLGLLQAPVEVLGEARTRKALVRVHELLCSQRHRGFCGIVTSSSVDTMIHAILKASRISHEICLTECHGWMAREGAAVWTGSARSLPEWALAQGLLNITSKESETTRSHLFKTILQAMSEHFSRGTTDGKDEDISTLLQSLLAHGALVIPSEVMAYFDKMLQGEGGEEGLQVTTRALMAFLVRSPAEDQDIPRIVFQKLLDYFHPSRVTQGSRCSHLLLVLLLALLLVRQPIDLIHQWSHHRITGVWRLFLDHYRGTYTPADRLILQAIEASERALRQISESPAPSPLPVLLLWGCQMLPDFAGIPSEDTMEEEKIDALPPLDEVMIRAALDRLEPRAILKTLRDFPDEAGETLDHVGLIRVTDAALENAEQGSEKRMDPSFWLTYALNLFGLSSRQSSLLLRGWVERNGLGLTLACLGSPNDRLRQIAYSLLDQIYPTLNEARIRFRGAGQVALLLTWVKDAITAREDGLDDLDESDRKAVLAKAYPCLPGPISTFVAQAVAILLNPEHHLFPSINRHLLQRPMADLQDIPLFYELFHSTSADASRGRIWLFHLLISGLRDSQPSTLPPPFVLPRRGLGPSRSFFIPVSHGLAPSPPFIIIGPGKGHIVSINSPGFGQAAFYPSLVSYGVHLLGKSLGPGTRWGGMVKAGLGDGQGIPEYQKDLVQISLQEPFMQ